MITYGIYEDLEQLDNLTIEVIEDMAKSNIPQWSIGYPASTHFKKDIELKALYVYKEKNNVLGSITVLPEDDPPYKTINSWIKDKSIVIHRMLVSPNARNIGVASKLLNKAIEIGINGNFESIKIDTHLENYKMRNFLKKNGFIELDYLETIDRIAYEKILEDK